ncbi:MAG: BamA/TamA family outer membrane protein [Candidatus Eisenbacteria bacterium]
MLRGRSRTIGPAGGSRLAAAVFLLCLAGPATPSPEAPDSAAAPKSVHGSRLFPPRLAARSVVFLPKVYYSTENRFGVGGHVVAPFWFQGDCEADGRRSDVRVKGRLTTDLHGKAEIEFNLRCADPWSLEGKFAYDNLALRFWGIGSDTPSENEEVYRPQSVLVCVELFRRVADGFRMGVRWEREQYKFIEVEPGGLLDTMEYVGLRGRRISGAGLLLDWDTRDHVYSPSRGRYYHGYTLFFEDFLGSAHTFNNHFVDLRHYLPLGGENVFATQLVGYSVRGAPPIYRYAALGGREHTRGYRTARYLDRVLLAFQGEYRFPLVWRFGGVAFGGLAGVSRNIESFRLDRMRPTVGAGLRLLVGDDDRIRLRFDAAFGEESARFYASIGEAF